MANYYMLGGDGKEYGPVTTEQLRQWAAEGRANAQTQVRPEAAGSSWVSFGAVPELNAPAGGYGAAMGNPALASVIAQTSGGYGGGDNAAQIKRLAAVLSAGGGWMKFFAVMMFIGGGLYAITIIGLVIAWLPIWLGVILWGAASKADLAFTTGNESDLSQALDKVRFYFKLNGIMLIIGFVLSIGWVFLAMSLGLAGMAGTHGSGP